MAIPISPFTCLPASVATEPAYNVLNSMALLNDVERLPGIRTIHQERAWPHVRADTWLARSAAALTPEQRRANRLVLGALRDALAPEREVADFQSYLDDLARQHPVALRDRALRRIARSAPGAAGPPDPARLLADAALYAAQIARRSPAEADPALAAEAHALLNDPPTLHDLIVAHLDSLWESMFAAEWGQTRQRLQIQVNVYLRCLDREAPAADIFRTFTGRLLPAELQAQAYGNERIVLVPSPHCGQYFSAWQSDGVLRVFFSPPPGYPVLMRNTAVGRAELRVRLAPLADETCLRIVKLLARQHDAQTQELIARLGLSQPSVSRHLKQLGMYLFERRGEGASKIYCLNYIELDRTARAVEQLTSGAAPDDEPAPEDRAEQPQELRRFLDARGRVLAWPSKHKDRLLVMEHLASLFEPERSYTEKEVNDLLAEHTAFDDHVTVRRALIDYRYLGRERDGSRYWRVEVLG